MVIQFIYCIIIYCIAQAVKQILYGEFVVAIIIYMRNKPSEVSQFLKTIAFGTTIVNILNLATFVKS